DENAVGVRPYVRSGREGHAGDRDGDVHLADAVLRGLPGVRSQRLDAEGQLADGETVADRAVHDDPGPSVLDGRACDEVADECGLERASAVDHEHRAVTGVRQ